MNHIIVLAPAKLNLTLDIVGVREDGYHLMEMVMQTISLADTIHLQKSPSMSIQCSGEVKADASNIAYKAAEAFFLYTKIEGAVTINIDKKIPIMAGMGGGSADGAAVLRGLNTLFEAGLSLTQLCEIGATIGADIPFCVYGGTALVSGIGEIVTPLEPLRHCYFVVAKPQISVDTKKAFAGFDAIKTVNHNNSLNMTNAIETGDLSHVSAELFNVFEQTIFADEIDELKVSMMLHGAQNAIMTGSGSAVFCIFANHTRAATCYDKMKQTFPNAEIFLCETV